MLLLRLAVGFALVASSSLCHAENSDRESSEGSRRKRVLVLGVDGLRPDALKAAETPHFDRLIADGAFSDKALTGRLTKSAPGWASMLTGAWPRKHGVETNDYSPTWQRLARYPTFPARLERLRPELVTASFANWVGINLFLLPDVDYKVRRATQVLSDDEVTDRAIALLETRDPDVVFVHFDGVDAAGHTDGFHPSSKEYLRAITLVDRRVGKILEALQARQNQANEDWLILSASDHGGKGRVHGSADPECRTIYFLAHGSGVRRGVIEPPPKVVDVAVTALVYLGIRPDPDWELDGQAVGLLPAIVSAAKIPVDRPDLHSSHLGQRVQAKKIPVGALSTFSYRGPSQDPHDGWLTPSSAERTEWSYAPGHDGVPGRINVHGPPDQLNWLRTSHNPAFTGDLTRYQADQLRISAHYWDTAPGKNLHDLQLKLTAKAKAGSDTTSWVRAAPGTIDLVYMPGQRNWSYVDLGIINVHWSDAEAMQAGWSFQDRGDSHVSFADTVRSVGTFAMSTNGSNGDWDVAYYDDIRIEPVQEPLNLPRLVPPVGTPDTPPIVRGAMSRELHGGLVINVANRKQLFLDDRFIVESSRGIRRVFHQPVKHPCNPIFIPQRPWEHGGITGGTVLHQGGLFRMWYRPHYGQHEVPGNGQIMRTAYAISQDGVNWQRPVLGLIEYNGSRENNLVLGNKAAEYGIHSARVVHTPWVQDAEKQYKMLLTFVRNKPPRWGFGVAFSPDGIRWEAHPQAVKADYHKHYGSFNTVFFDSLSQRYVAYYQRRPQQKFPQPVMPSGARHMGRMESKDFLNWTDPNYLAHGPDEDDPVGSDLFEPAPFQYTDAAYVYLNAAVWYDEYTDQTWVRLASSRDNLIWRWMGDRQPFIPNGPEGTWDSMMIHPMFVPPVVFQDELYFYYTAKTTKQRPFQGIGKNDGSLAKAGHPRGYEDFCLFSVGLAKMRLDGFVSLVAGVRTGSFTTHPIQFAGAALQLNVDASTTIGATRSEDQITELLDHGVQIELLDERGRVIPGFSREDCDPIRKDDVRYRVTWNGSPDVSRLAGKPVKLRFYLRFAKVYAFQFTD